MNESPMARMPADGANRTANVLTLRDHFATIALSKLIALRLHETAERKALEAYQIADSMMRQREREETGR